MKIECIVKIFDPDISNVLCIAEEFLSFCGTTQKDELTYTFIFQDYKDAKFFAFRAENIENVESCSGIPIYNPKSHK